MDKRDKDSGKERRVKTAGDYSAESIVIMQAREAVRKRPAMYIGSTADLGLHHLVRELVDTSIDEAFAGFCDRIDVTIHNDNSITVADNGRGISVEEHRKEKRPFAEIVLTTLCCGGTPNRAGPPQGVGISVVNFLSESLRITIWRDGVMYEQEYRCGVPLYSLRKVRETRRHGTRITFKPDPEIFQVTRFNFRLLSTYLRERAFLKAGLRVTLNDERTEKSKEFFYPGGIAEFVKSLSKNKGVLNDEPIYIAGSVGDEKPPDVEAAVQFTGGTGELVISFVNDVNTIGGGTHVTGLRAGVSRAINSYAKSSGLMNEDDGFSVESVCDGLVALINARLSNPYYPHFEGAASPCLTNADEESL